MTVVVTPAAAGTITNTATASAASPDPNLANNSASAQTIVSAPSPPPSGGGGFGGGGGGGGGALPGYTSLSPYINDEGRFNLEASVCCESGDACVNIAKGVVGKDQTGGILKQMGVFHIGEAAQAPPADSRILGIHEILPDGAGFTPVVTLSVKFESRALPADVRAAGLYIARWDGARWQPVQTVVNEAAGMATAGINGYGKYALLGKVVPPVPPPAQTTAPVGPTTQPAPSTTTVPVPVTTPTPPTSPAGPAAPAAGGVPWGAIFGIMGGLVVIAAAVTIVIVRKRRAVS